MVEAQNPRRCGDCRMIVRLCLCAIMPQVETKMRLVLIINHAESRRNSNSGLLASRCLTNSEVHVSGAKDRPLNFDQIAPHDEANLFLFPTADALPLSLDWTSTLTKPIRLIVPDGTWSQAAKIRRKVPSRHSLTYVTLQDLAPSTYRLRRAAKDLPKGLATLEAIAQAIASLEGTSKSEPLMNIFRTFVERTLWARGKLPEDQVFGGIPVGGV